MITLEFNAFGMPIKRFTFLSVEDSYDILKNICPTINDFKFKHSTKKEMKSLKSKITFSQKKRFVSTRSIFKLKRYKYHAHLKHQLEKKIRLSAKKINFLEVDRNIYI